MKMNERIRELLQILCRIVNRVTLSPITPAVSLVLFVLTRDIIRRDGDYWLMGVNLIMGLLGLIAVIRCYRQIWVRRISIGVMALVMVLAVSGMIEAVSPGPSGARTAAAESPRKTSAKRNDDLFDDNPEGSGTCVYCSGTGTCHICGGFGKEDCGSCMNGSCPVCRGGMDSDSCSFCYGTGFCPTCDGHGSITCKWCSGTGECDHCNGTGER